MGQYELEVSQAFGNLAQSFVLMNIHGFKTSLPVLISDNSSSAEEPKYMQKWVLNTGFVKVEYNPNQFRLI